MKKVLFLLCIVALVFNSCNNVPTDSFRYEGGILQIIKYKNPDMCNYVLAHHLGVDSTGLDMFAIGDIDLKYIGSLPPFIELHNGYLLLNWASSYDARFSRLLYFGGYSLDTAKNDWYLLPLQWSEADTSQVLLYADIADARSFANELETGVMIYYSSLCHMLGIPCEVTNVWEIDDEDEATYRWREIKLLEDDPKKIAQYDRWWQEYRDGLNALIDQGDSVFMKTLNDFHADIFR